MLAELANLFPDARLHVGFDEVNLDDWNTTAIANWMAARNFTKLRQVESYFLNAIRALSAKYLRNLTIWDDPVGEGVTVPMDVQLQVWNSDLSLVNQLTSQGYSVVYSSPFYLDNLANTWDTMYEVDLHDPTPDGLIGLESCMWGEKVDETNAQSRVWPRAAAVAELLWSPDSTLYPKVAGLATERIAALRCRIRRRGVNAEPIEPSWCPFAPH